MADPNCQYCHGTGTVEQVLTEGGNVTIRRLRCHC